LRELYPDVSIQILYQHDFRKLLYKYGIAATPLTRRAGGGFEPSRPTKAIPYRRTTMMSGQGRLTHAWTLSSFLRARSSTLYVASARPSHGLPQP
jgi:hypothetical protein